MTLVNSTLTNNSAGDSGGAICTSYESYGGNYGLTTVLNCVFSGNTAESCGGGIYQHGTPWQAGTLTVMNSTFSGNSAVSIGGAVYASSTILTVDNSTIAGNSASRQGGISCSPPCTLVNSIVAQNLGGDMEAGVTEESGGNLIGVDPGFVRDPGTDGPGDFGDLRLLSQSPAINSGEIDLLPQDTWDIDRDGNTSETLPVDSDGNPRVFGESPDIGAYEYQSSPAEGRETPSTVVTTSDDVFNLYDGRISIRDAVFYAQHASSTASITFVPELSGATILLGGVSISVEGEMTIDASSLPGGLVIDGDGRSRVFDILNGPGRPVMLRGLTVTNGCASHAGGILNSYGNIDC